MKPYTLKLKTVSREYPFTKALALANRLMLAGVWVAVDPLPDDQALVIVKAEAAHHLK